MNKLLDALRRAFDTPQLTPTVHFHSGATIHHPEVCHEATCDRPRLSSL